MRPLRWLIPALVLAALACAPGAVAQPAQQRIIGGDDVTIADHPYQVGLYRDGGFICGGSILDDTTVITAAHCVTTKAKPHSQLAASRFTVHYGSSSRSSPSTKTVSVVKVPKGYTGAGVPDESYDVALLTLSTAIDLAGDPNAEDIPLAPPGLDKTTGTAFATGWGVTEDEDEPNTLQGVDLPLLSDATCSNHWNDPSAPYPTYEASRSVCAGGGSSLPEDNPDTCNGDSGGPLAVDTDPGPAKDWVLLGLTSYGEAVCGTSGAPAVYTWVQGTNIETFITSRGVTDNSAVRAGPTSSTPVTAVVAPVIPPTTAARDTTRPTAKLSRLSCTKKRKCSFRIAAADKGGTVRKLAATVTRKVRTCKRRGDFRVCSTTTRKKTLKPKRISGGFIFSATLAKATYKLSSVATDAAGNRSKALSKTFRVR